MENKIIFPSFWKKSMISLDKKKKIYKSTAPSE